MGKEEVEERGSCVVMETTGWYKGEAYELDRERERDGDIYLEQWPIFHYPLEGCSIRNKGGLYLELTCDAAVVVGRSLAGTGDWEEAGDSVLPLTPATHTASHSSHKTCPLYHTLYYICTETVVPL